MCDAVTEMAIAHLSLMTEVEDGFHGLSLPLEIGSERAKVY